MLRETGGDAGHEAYTVRGALSNERPYRAPPKSGANPPYRYVFSRYPVLKIHATIAMKRPRNTIVIARLTPTLTSAMS